jgi:hypothetical protein
MMETINLNRKRRRLVEELNNVASESAKSIPGIYRIGYAKWMDIMSCHARENLSVNLSKGNSWSTTL